MEFHKKNRDRQFPDLFLQGESPIRAAPNRYAATSPSDHSSLSRSAWATRHNAQWTTKKRLPPSSLLVSGSHPSSLDQLPGAAGLARPLLKLRMRTCMYLLTCTSTRTRRGLGGPLPCASESAPAPDPDHDDSCAIVLILFAHLSKHGTGTTGGWDSCKLASQFVVLFVLLTF